MAGYTAAMTTETEIPDDPDIDDTDKRETSESHAKDNEVRNLWILVWYSVSLRCGWIFKTETVVMPTVLDLLSGGGNSAGWIRGMLPLLNKLGQSVPPLLAADLVRRRPRKSTALVTTSALMAVAFAAVAGLWALRGTAPTAVLVTGFLLLYGCFFASVGLNGLAFNTVQGKLVRPERRGRLLGIGAVIGSFAAVGIAWLLMPRWLAWPNATGFVPIFLASASGYAIAAALCWMLRETPDADEPRIQRKPFSDVGRLLKSDRRFRMAAIVAALTSAAQMMFPHYQWIGREMLGTELGDLFWWVMAQNMTVATIAPVAGGLGDRFGNRLALRTMVGLSVLPPLLAGTILWTTRLGIESTASWYWVVFCLLGLTPVTVRTLLNYTLELADPVDHPRYVSSMQVCLAVPFVVSPLAGLLVGGTENRAVGVTWLIGIVLATLIIAFAITFTLAEVRHESKEAAVD